MTAATRTLLTWKPGKYSSHGGSANGIHLFSITWKTTRSAPDWTMQTALPGTSSRGWQSDDLGELKATAEKVLANWIARVTWTTETTTETGDPR